MTMHTGRKSYSSCFGVQKYLEPNLLVKYFKDFTNESSCNHFQQSGIKDKILDSNPFY